MPFLRMPFINSIEFRYAFSGNPATAASTIGGLPSYYQNNSGYLMYQPGFTATTLIC
jgi:hypothetical protein